MNKECQTKDIVCSLAASLLPQRLFPSSAKMFVPRHRGPCAGTKPSQKPSHRAQSQVGDPFFAPACTGESLSAKSLWPCQCLLCQMPGIEHCHTPLRCRPLALTFVEARPCFSTTFHQTTFLPLLPGRLADNTRAPACQGFSRSVTVSRRKIARGHAEIRSCQDSRAQNLHQKGPAPGRTPLTCVCVSLSRRFQGLETVSWREKQRLLFVVTDKSPSVHSLSSAPTRPCGSTEPWAPESGYFQDHR